MLPKIILKIESLLEIEIIKLLGYMSVFLIVLNEIFFDINVKFLIMFPMLGFTIIILFYNGKQGKRIKYFFYWFYPIHMLVIYGLSLIFK